MKHLFVRGTALVFAIMMLVSAYGCAAEPVATATEPAPITIPSVSDTPTTTEDPVVIPTLPDHMNPLTGLEIDESLVGKRPVAIMLNNIKDALPQSGLSKCDIIYEVLAEGGILRLEGLILDYEKAGNLGSVRSARPYYVELAAAYDAIYVHAGGSQPYAYDKIASLKVNNIDCLVYDGSVIGGEKVAWRDQIRLNNGYGYEHTLFTSGMGIAAAAAARKYRTELADPDFTAFQFDAAFSSIGSGKKAEKVVIPHSDYSVSEFRYNPETKLYYHSQYGKAHVDGVTGAQVTTDNVFMIFSDMGLIPGDTKGRLQAKLTGEGKGYYLCGGEYQSIVWKRATESSPFTYFNEDGTPLSVKPGKSYVSIVDTDTVPNITIS